MQRYTSTRGAIAADAPSSALLGAIDGIYGIETARAVTEFQAKRGLRPSGVVDDATFESLSPSASEAPQSPQQTPRPRRNRTLLDRPAQADELGRVAFAPREFQVTEGPALSRALSLIAEVLR